MGTHKDLDVWRLGIELVKSTYKLTKNLPDSEKFGLASQMQRASVSIPTNIAEGAARKGKKEYSHFSYISLGSLSELETLVIICKELAFIEDTSDIENEITELRRKLLSFIKFLSN